MVTESAKWECLTGDCAALSSLRITNGREGLLPNKKQKNKYRRITSVERAIIETLWNDEKLRRSEISRAMGITWLGIDAELKRGFVTTEGVMLFELTLHGLDMYSDLNLELLDAMNPVLVGAPGVSLAPHTEYTLRLPYNLRKMHYTSETWDNMHNRKFWLKLTSFPTVKEISLI
jgi:hypothetical protein